MASLVKVNHLHRLLNVSKLWIPSQGLSSSSKQCSKQIAIPNRIHRSPTDILQALSATVGADPTGTHYKYHDDPFLIPSSNMEKRSYSLSKESGRKAARWIVNEHGELFQHNPEQPVIEAFYPKVVYNEESNISEATIEELINNYFVSDAIKVYQICKSKGVELSDKIRQDLLEFVCYHNCEDVPDEDCTEDRWYNQVFYLKQGGNFRTTWKNNGFAEELFQNLNNKDSRAYCALIQGMSKYLQIDKTWQLYQEALEKDIALDTNTFNSVIRIAHFQREGYNLRWQCIKEVLQTMAHKDIAPNLGTLNSTLDVLVFFGKWEKRVNVSLEILSEFLQLGIKPSLGTYYSLLCIHCKERGLASNILTQILTHAEGTEFKIRDLRDTDFFAFAMEVACNHLKCLDTARRVEKMLHLGENRLLIGSSFKESVYYRNFLRLVCESETVDNFMEFYTNLVPHAYTPEPNVMVNILSSLNIQHALSYLPQMYSDIVIFDHIGQAPVVAELLAGMSTHNPTEENEELTNQLSNIAFDVWTKLQNQNEKRRNKVTLSGEMISNLLTTLTKGQKYNHAKDVFTVVIDGHPTILGTASFESLRLLCNAAIEKGDTYLAIKVINYAVDSGHQEVGDLAKEVSSKMNLSSLQKSKLTSLFGAEMEL